MRRYLPRSIFARSLLIVLVPIVILQIVLAVVFYERHWENVTRYRVNTVAGDIRALIWMHDTHEAGGYPDLAISIGSRFFDFRLRFLPGERLPADVAATREGRVERLLGKVLDTALHLPFTIDSTQSPDTVVSVELPEGVLVIGVPKKRVESRTTDLFVYWMLGTSAALALVAAYFVRQQIRPIHRLASAAERFGRGIIDVEFKPSGATEVRQAAHAFLAMRERIRRQIEQRTLMLASVSHDLRTPLTRMKLELAFFEKSEEVENLRRDIEEMEHMIDVYLAFARGQGEEKSQAFDLAATMREVASEAPCGIDTRIAGTLPFTGRRSAIRRCLANIVENACRHGAVTVLEARRENGSIGITLDDDGPGIPPESRAKAFQAFVRLDDSRDPGRSGSGLGLTIANDVVRSHGGEISLEDSALGGLRVRITLPVPDS